MYFVLLYMCVSVHCIYNMHTFAILYIQIAFGFARSSTVCVHKQMHDRILKKPNESDVYTDMQLCPRSIVSAAQYNKSHKRQTAKICDATEMWIWIFIGKHIENTNIKMQSTFLESISDVIAFVCNRLNCVCASVFFFVASGVRMLYSSSSQFCLHLRLHHIKYIHFITLLESQTHQMCVLNGILLELNMKM